MCNRVHGFASEQTTDLVEAIRSITDEEVAALAGGSRSAVSSAFAEVASLASETLRQGIDAAAAGLTGCPLNGIASTLAKKRTAGLVADNGDRRAVS